MATLIALCVASCGDDEETPESTITGTWHKTAEASTLNSVYTEGDSLAFACDTVMFSITADSMAVTDNGCVNAMVSAGKYTYQYDEAAKRLVIISDSTSRDTLEVYMLLRDKLVIVDSPVDTLAGYTTQSLSVYTKQ